MARTGIVRFSGGILAAALLLTACGSGSGGAGGGSTDSATGSGVSVGLVGAQSSDATPQQGGTLSYATFSPVSSLDPVTMFPAGSSGGSEAAAIYDLLVRYDASTSSYEPQLAEDIQVSADNTTWTLTLREGAKFSDASPVDAEAVMWSINRYVDKGGYNGKVFAGAVASMSAPNPSTVVIELNEPWSDFWSLLATGVGLIVAPSSDQGAKFTPIGAGPFAVERFSPTDELVLKARPDYWGGAPSLDTLKFVNISGDEAKADAFRTGGVDMAYLRSPESVEELRAAGAAGFVEAQSQGSMVVINNRAGHAGADVRVRQAMVNAIDPDVVDSRVNNSKGMPGSALFQDWSRWHSDVAPTGYDATQAKTLLAQAKADGFTGNVTYATMNDPVSQARALAVQAMLQAAGFTVTIDYSSSPTDLTKKVYGDHDFDLASGALSVWDPAPYLRLYSALGSDSDGNGMGFADPEMDQLLKDVKGAGGEDQKRAALAAVQGNLNETAPYVPLGALATFVPWQQNVHGVKPSLDSIMLFDKAFLAS